MKYYERDLLESIERAGTNGRAVYNVDLSRPGRARARWLVKHGLVVGVRGDNRIAYAPSSLGRLLVQGALGWRKLAEEAREACRQEQPLSYLQKLAVVCEALVRSETQPMCGRTLAQLASRAPLEGRAFAAICRSNMREINAMLRAEDGSERNYVYDESGYHPSGAGAFGRLGGGQRGKYHPASIVDMKGVENR